MQLLFRLFACILLLSCISCSTYQSIREHAAEIKSCKLSCIERLKTCANTCRNNCNNCTSLDNAAAAVHFNQYKRQQILQGQIVALELQSYKDPLQCRKTTCNCREDYGVCIQSCNGQIRKRLQVVAPC